MQAYEHHVLLGYLHFPKQSPNEIMNKIESNKLAIIMTKSIIGNTVAKKIMK